MISSTYLLKSIVSLFSVRSHITGKKIIAMAAIIIKLNEAPLQDEQELEKLRRIAKILRRFMKILQIEICLVKLETM